MIDFVTTPTILESSVTGCHGNHAFSHSLNQFIYGDFFLHSHWVPGNNLAPIQICPWGAR